MSLKTPAAANAATTSIRAGLTVPDTGDLLDRLRKDGLDLPLDALTVDECAAAITACLTKN